MGNWVDILVIVLVGLFVASRFFSFKLPKDSRNRTMRKADFAKMFSRHTPAEPKTEGPEGNARKPAKPLPPPVKKVSAKDLAGLSGIEKIKAMEPAFDESKFLQGAKTAYDYFYKCWNTQNEQGLMDLCAPRLVDEIVAGWERKWQKVDVKQIQAVEIGEARVSGRTAIVEALFEVKAAKGKVAKTVRETWVLARAIGSDEPNWELQSFKVVGA